MFTHFLACGTELRYRLNPRRPSSLHLNLHGVHQCWTAIAWRCSQDALYPKEDSPDEALVVLALILHVTKISSRVMEAPHSWILALLRPVQRRETPLKNTRPAEMAGASFTKYSERSKVPVLIVFLHSKALFHSTYSHVRTCYAPDHEILTTHIDPWLSSI